MAPMQRMNPLDLSEIRTRISLYLSNTDAISCAQVSKEWSIDFIRPIWHTIDFSVHTSFENLDPVAVAKNGHHIRVVKDLKRQSHIDALQCSEVCKLLSLTVVANRTPLFDATCRDLIARNNISLTTLEINLIKSLPETTAPLYAPVDSIVPRYSSTSGSRLRTLKATTQQALGQQSRLLPSNQSLLRHFPNLETWTLIAGPESNMNAIKDEVRKWCPKLNRIKTNGTPEASVIPLLVDVFSNLRALTFQYTIFSSNLVHAILAHHNTLEHLATYKPREEELEQKEPSRLNDHFQDLDWIVQNIPRYCSKLRTFFFFSHEMDMDVAERTSWSFKDIEILCIRIRGLDTAEKINSTISRLNEAKRAKRATAVTEITHEMESSTLDTEIGLAKEKDNNTAVGTNYQVADKGNDMSIEARVVRHLLQFDKLNTLWLGTKLYRV
ncbi:hypothetical protein BG011_003141 [Mortierella polycephala]|uniref:F-box domain-containing protein n=1 Tax=Mortierella polycephala TaxID=41804 RepID=A0A9P6QFM1_9FUNG|nr:hypothetical protein BG011_003141 [Mortierella polycephala]